MIPEGLRELLESEDDAVFDQGKEIAMTLYIPQEEVVAVLPIARLVEEMDAAPSDLWSMVAHVRLGRYASGHSGLVLKWRINRLMAAISRAAKDEAHDLMQRSEDVRAARKVLSEYKFFYNMDEDEGWDL